MDAMVVGAEGRSGGRGASIVTLATSFTLLLPPLRQSSDALTDPNWPVLVASRGGIRIDESAYSSSNTNTQQTFTLESFRRRPRVRATGAGQTGWKVDYRNLSVD
jgi:hypothetical protein